MELAYKEALKGEPLCFTKDKIRIKNLFKAPTSALVMEVPSWDRWGIFFRHHGNPKFHDVSIVRLWEEVHYALEGLEFSGIELPAHIELFLKGLESVGVPKKSFEDWL